MKKNRLLFVLLSFTVISFSLNANLFPFRKNNKYGLMDQDLKIQISAKYDLIRPEDNNKYFIASKTQNNIIKSEIFDENGIQLYKAEGIINHIYNDYFSLSTKNGEVLFSLHSDKVLNAYKFISSEEPKIPLRKDVNYEYINESGIELFPELEFRRAYGFNENRSVNINLNWEYEVINEKGDYIFGKEFQELAQHYSEGLLYATKMNGETGYVDYMGNFTIKIPTKKHEENNIIATNFYKGRAIINSANNGICIIDKNGTILEKEIKVSWFYDFCEDFSLVVFEDGSYNFLTLKGEFLSPKNFSFAKNFCNGYAIVTINGKVGLLNKEGILFFL